jgi:hypothetical protein
MDEGFLWERHKGRYHDEDKDISGKIILKLVLEEYDVVAWTGFI